MARGLVLFHHEQLESRSLRQPHTPVSRANIRTQRLSGPHLQRVTLEDAQAEAGTQLSDASQASNNRRRPGEVLA